uniref:Uncharacterized protein n=1 Tax=Arundo donax TaxID=35708 RepID=A0A0A9E1W0_ARUDO
MIKLTSILHSSCDKCCSNSDAAGLISGSFCKHFNRKSLTSGERCSGIGGCDFVVPT